MGFQVGDVVVCVDADYPGRATPLKRGAFYRITEITIGVLLAEVDPPKGFISFKSERFRKLPKADAQFAARIRACKPQRVGEPA